MRRAAFKNFSLFFPAALKSGIAQRKDSYSRNSGSASQEGCDRETVDGLSYRKKDTAGHYASIFFNTPQSLE